jgi:hypothetical protein
LIAESEPISEELMPIVSLNTFVLSVGRKRLLNADDSQANKLSTVTKCLNEVLKYGGPFSARDLYPVSCR